MDLTPESKVDTLGIDQRWIGSTHNLDSGETGTLTTATLQAHKNSLGILPSGVLLGRITATDTYGLFDPAADDGRQIFAGVLLSDEKITNSAGVAVAKVGASILRHGVLRKQYLPVVAQRAQVEAALATSSGLFTLRD